VASAYIDRWTMLLGVVFVLIVMFVPGGIVPGLQRGWQRLRARRPAAAPVVAELALKEAGEGVQ
jgi:branched-chain amino acid transport system permease protein